MTEKKHDADQLVRTYIKIRDAKEELTRKYEEEVGDLDKSLNLLEAELLEICKSTGQSGGRTPHGTFSMRTSTFYTSTNWDAMRQFVKEHDAIDLLQQRIHQGNMKAFLQDHPDLLPEGLNVDSRYTIVVRRASK